MDNHRRSGGEDLDVEIRQMVKCEEQRLQEIFDSQLTSPEGRVQAVEDYGRMVLRLRRHLAESKRWIM